MEFSEQDDAYVLRAELPGMQRDDITVKCRNGMLTLCGEQTVGSTPDRAVPRIKHGYCAFAQRFPLQKPVEANAMARPIPTACLQYACPKWSRCSTSRAHVSSAMT